MALISWVLLFLCSLSVSQCLGYSYRQPSVMVVLLARNKEHTLPYFLTLFQQLDYPKERISLYVRADHCQDQTINILDTWLADVGHQYHALDVVMDSNTTLYPGESGITDKRDASYQAIIDIKEAALNKARQVWADYVFFLDVDVFITEPDMLSILMEENVPIIAPMANSLGRYSNFWGGMSEEYWYVRTDEYMNILDRKEKGCFVVPMVHSCVLVNLKVTETDMLTFDPDLVAHHDDLPLDDIISFAISAKEADLEMTICNEKLYVFMSPPVIENERAELDLVRLKSLKLEVLVDQPPLPTSPLLRPFLPLPPVKDKFNFDQVYLINLDRRQERRERMEQCFQVTSACLLSANLTITINMF